MQRFRSVPSQITSPLYTDVVRGIETEVLLQGSLGGKQETLASGPSTDFEISMTNKE